MAVKYNMRIQILTLVDITQTGARKGDDPFKQRQQQNYLTTIQTASLRANPTVTAAPKKLEGNAADYCFGNAHTGKVSVWKLTLFYEQQVDNLLELLKEDFNLVPFIAKLDETTNFDFSIFDTTDIKYKNIILIEQNDGE